MINFERTIDPNDHAIHYIKEAIKRTPANTVKASTVINNIRNNKGDLFLIMKNYHTVGIVYITIYHTENGKIVCPLLVSGSNSKEWQDDLRKFLINFKNKTKAIAINFIARTGWKKLFPECEIIGSIYEYRGGLAE